MQDELLDLVNEQDEIIGTVWKSEAHQNPKLIHREVAVGLFSKDGEVLLQQRSLNKKIKPGVWVLSATGHVSSGEDPAKAAGRELKEELGISLVPEYFNKAHWERDGREARFFWYYYAIVSQKPPLEPDPQEVMATAWVPLSKLVDFARDHDYDLNGNSHKIIMEMAQSLMLSK